MELRDRISEGESPLRCGKGMVDRGVHAGVAENDGAREEHDRRHIDRERHRDRGVPSHVRGRPVLAVSLRDHDVSNATHTRAS
jgi:hypothetical protein